MDLSLERDSSALGSLFQQIINDMKARFFPMHFERGDWEPTVFTLATPDFCASMFDKDHYWFKYWTSFIMNREEVQEKCLKNRGTVLAHNPFAFRLILRNIFGPTLKGRYKLVCTFEAFDEKGIPRPNSICFEIRGEVEKVKK